MHTTKICSKCQVCKPMTSDFFFKDTRRQDGLQSACKVCREADRKPKAKKVKVACTVVKEAKNNYNPELLVGVTITCKDCQEEKPATKEFFHICKANKFGLAWSCKVCKCKNDKDKYYSSNKKVTEEQRVAKLIKSREYRLNNREKVLKMKKDYRDRNGKVIYQKHRERMEQDALYAAKINARVLIGQWMYRRGVKKSKSSEDIFGCTAIEFFKYIEDQFVEGMTWENRSEWHIDHIIPLATAETVEEVMKLCHYTNLRPLWAKDNLSKGAKILPELFNSVVRLKEECFA